LQSLRGTNGLGVRTDALAFGKGPESFAGDSIMTHVRPIFVPTPYQDAADAGRLILRDGSTAQVRIAQCDDQEKLTAFFKALTPESRYRRFFSMGLPPTDFIRILCDSSKPAQVLTLIVTRIVKGEDRIIATASYQAVHDKTAEVAFAVDEGFHGKGLATLLLERLAVLAAQKGLLRFWAITQADNRPMIEVFHESGLQVREKPDGGFLEVELSVVPGEKFLAKSEMRDRIATTASLRPFFKPQAVAVIGASRDPNSIGYRIVDALVRSEFRGPIYPINPKADQIAAHRAYPDVRDVPQEVDLAVIAVPRDVVPNVIEDCAFKGIRALVIITAGFAEVGQVGRKLQNIIAAQVRGHGMRMIGPNCMGLINTDPEVRLNASFSPVVPPPGRVAMSSQSGALGLAILSAAKRLQLGLGYFVSVGNKADVSGNDLLEYWEDDAHIAVILLYLESFGNPRRFSRIARRVSRRKPIVALKAGRTAAGGRAAGSHTAALAGSDVAVDALFQQTGVIRAETLEQMFDLAVALGTQPLPRGRRVAIITNAGGPGILCADACEADGLAVPELSKELKAQLAVFLPAAASLGNPVDMIASAGPEHYRQTTELVLASGEVDCLVIIYIPVGLNEPEAISAAIGQGVGAARKKGGENKPVLACMMSDEAKEQLDLNDEKVPCFAYPEAAAHVLGKAVSYAEWRARPAGMILDFDDLDHARAREICRQAKGSRGSGWLSTAETRALLKTAALPIPPSGVAETADEAVNIAKEIGFPVAVKLASHQLVHKTEIGGIFLNLRDEATVRLAFDQIRDRLARDQQLAAMEGVLVQPMVAGGVEVMVGMTEDPSFGPLIAFGLGGIHVEILGDVCFRVTPLTDRDAREMVESIRGYRLLQGYRGHPAADIEALQEILLRISRLVEEVPEIQELDLNPIFALPPGQGCRIVDARIRV
jgi:acetyl coenzyme A synthetase (ADP forming)-like protein